MNPRTAAGLLSAVVLGIVGIALVTKSDGATSSPTPTPCTKWKYPARFADIPKDVVDRSTELQFDLSKPLGYRTIEVWHGVTYRFSVLMPANASVNHPHRGAEVEICA